MNFHAAAILSLSLIFLKSLEARISSSCTYTLHVYNDGPVTLDVPVEVTAFLECADEDEKYMYIFEDDNGHKVTQFGHGTAGATFIFVNRAGTRRVRVKAYLLHFGLVRVASGSTLIEVHEYIPGNLEIAGSLTARDGRTYIAAGKDTNMSISIYCPRAVFNDAEFSYSWTVEESRYISRHPYLIHQFQKTGPQWIRASVVARIPSYDQTNTTRYKWGYFDGQVEVKNPFVTFDISGNTYLQHGQLLDLEISCNGSGPIDYCWKVLSNSENHTNLSCSEPVSVMECSFPIIYYFQESGKFILAIYVDNFVSFKQRNVEIHIYDVSLQPQLSTIIIPMVCTILVVFIVAGAVLAHIRRKNSYDVETADFDFMVPDEGGKVVIETSWEYMLRSFLQLLRIPYIYYTTEVQRANYGTIAKH